MIYYYICLLYPIATYLTFSLILTKFAFCESKVHDSIMKYEQKIMSKKDSIELDHTVYKKHITNFNVINKVIIVYANTIFCTNPSFYCEGELLTTYQVDWLWQVTTSNFWSLKNMKKERNNDAFDWWIDWGEGKINKSCDTDLTEK